MGRLIDADALIGIIGITFTDREHGNPHFFNGLATAVEIIKNAEEAVVRCKDCKWWKEETEYEWDGETELKQQLCTEHEAYFEPDDFCSYGERREDAEE